MPPCGLPRSVPFRRPVRAGERASLGAEELGLDERLRDRRGVHRDERPVAPPRQGVERARATSSLPVPLSPASRTVASVPASFSTLPVELLHRRAAPTRSTRRSRSRTSSAEAPVLVGEPARRSVRSTARRSAAPLERLRQVVVGPGADRRDGVGDRPVGRRHHERRVRAPRVLTSARSSMPSRPGSFQSDRTRSTGERASSASAASTEPASATAYPAPRRIPATSLRWSISSSTRRSRASGTAASVPRPDVEDRARVPRGIAVLEDEAPRRTA